MKRIAATIALASAVLAIPATAMASTSGSGIGGGNSGYSQVNPGGPRLVFCPLPRGVHLKQPGQAVQITYSKGRVAEAYRKVDKTIGRFFCRVPRRLPKPPAQVCVPGTVTFDMPPSSGTFTEYSGPQLYAGENFYYGGTKYTIESVSASVFTLNADGSSYTNGGVSVVDGKATAVCAGSSIGS